MKISDIIASIGVIILLIAFLLNLYKKLPAESKTYALLNFIGAGTFAAYASYMDQLLSVCDIGGDMGRL